MLYFNIIISIILVIMALIKKNSKITFYALLLWMWILFAFNNMNADYEMYKMLYDNGENYSAFHNFEPIFKQLYIIGNNLNIPYETFIAIYSLIGLLILSIAIRKSTKNFSFALACYFLFPFFIDIVQIRHFMAFVILTYAFQYLGKTTKKDIIKYYILNIIAIGFHSASLVFLILPIIQLIPMKKLIIGITAIDIILIVFARLNILPALIAKIVTGEKYVLYFSGTQWQNGLNGIFVFGTVQIGVLVILYLVRKLWNMQKIKNIDNINQEEMNIRERKFEAVFKSNIFLLIIIPFYYYLVELARIFRIILLTDYIVIGNSITKKSIYNNMYIKIITIIIIIILFIFLILYVGILDKTVISILSNNYILENII